MSSSYTKTRIMVECALMIALGTILANIKIYELPNGGSITLFSMCRSFWYPSATGSSGACSPAL